MTSVASTSAEPGHRTRRAGSLRVTLTLIGLAPLLLGVAVARLTIGETIGFPASDEILAIRLDRLLVGGTVGASLAVAGAILQALLSE